MRTSTVSGSLCFCTARAAVKITLSPPCKRAISLANPNYIESRLQVVRELINQHPESAILYGWSLVEATLRLVAEHEELSLKRVDPLYLIKHFTGHGSLFRIESNLINDSVARSRSSA